MSELTAPLFGDPDVDRALADRSQVQAMLDVEAALAESQAAVGLIPVAAADAIRQAASVDGLDLPALASAAPAGGNLAIPLVSALAARVPGTAAGFVHLGATSQDVIDTATVLLLRRAVPLVLARLRQAADAAAGHAVRHASTTMAGRTWLQHATPITFGLKAAGWCEALDRGAERLERALVGASVLQLGGGSGTLAAFGIHADAIARSLATRLELALPTAPWHAHRDRLAEVAAALGIAAGTLGKIGRDVSLLAQTEVAEASEGASGGSSTMPQKRNPVRSAVAMAAAVRAPGLVATMLGAMPQEQERGPGGWLAEWDTLPELVRVTGGAARAVAELLTHLVIDADRIARNVASTDGAIAAEALAMALAPAVGRPAAHQLIEAVAARARRNGRRFLDVAIEDPAVLAHRSRAEIAALLDPARYHGQAEAIVARILAGRGARG